MLQIMYNDQENALTKEEFFVVAVKEYFAEVTIHGSTENRTSQVLYLWSSPLHAS